MITSAAAFKYICNLSLKVLKVLQVRSRPIYLTVKVQNYFICTELIYKEQIIGHNSCLIIQIA